MNETGQNRNANVVSRIPSRPLIILLLLVLVVLLGAALNHSVDETWVVTVSVQTPANAPALLPAPINPELASFVNQTTPEDIDRALQYLKLSAGGKGDTEFACSVRKLLESEQHLFALREKKIILHAKLLAAGVGIVELIPQNTLTAISDTKGKRK
jgi:hypothetical protein